MEGRPTSTIGTLYQLGRHRLLVGDATQPADLRRLMGRSKAAMMLTDPPYNVGYEGKTEAKLAIAGDRQSESEFRQFLEVSFRNAHEELVPGGAFYIWYPAGKPDAFYLACAAVGWQIRQHLVWIKNHASFGRSDYHWKHEPCIYGWRSGAAHRWHGDRKQTTVLLYDRPGRNREHPTMKPVPMFERLITNSTAAGELVLDPFAGSGTTLLACETTGRTARVLEIDPVYADVIRRRWAVQVHGESIDWAAATPAISLPGKRAAA